MKGLLLALVLVSTAAGANPVVSVIDARTFKLNDGTIIRLKNTAQPVSETGKKTGRTVLQLWLLDRNVELQNEEVEGWTGVVEADVVWRGLNIGDQMVKKGYLLRPEILVEQTQSAAPVIQQQSQPQRRVYRTYSVPSYEVYQGSSYYPYQSPVNGSMCVGNT